MEIRTAISLEKVLDTVYALSALRSYDSAESRPAILGRGQAKALRVLARNSVAAIVFDLLPYATGSNILGADTDADVITVDFDIPAENTHLATVLENAITYNLLATVWAGHHTASTLEYASMASETIATIKRTLHGLPGSILPAA